MTADNTVSGIVKDDTLAIQTHQLTKAFNSLGAVDKELDGYESY
ncbi:hypothetical protein ACFLV8_01060 [Chloroflexota bacterium]